jgi:hypothetical protein
MCQQNKILLRQEIRSNPIKKCHSSSWEIGKQNYRTYILLALHTGSKQMLWTLALCSSLPGPLLQNNAKP